MRRIFMLLLAVPLVVVGYAGSASATVVAQHVSVTLDANGTGPAVSTGAINDTGTFTTLSQRQSGKSHTSHGTFRIDFAIRIPFSLDFVTDSSSATPPKRVDQKPD